MSFLKRLAVGILSIGIVAPAWSRPPEMQIEKVKEAYRVSVVANGKKLLQSPEEGLWSIALGWKEDWPDDWKHVPAIEKTESGEWTLLRGSLKLPGGEWRFIDAYRAESGMIRCKRRFEWHGDSVLTRCTLAVRFQTPGTGKGVLMPGILYYGNPSGAASGHVPVFTGKPGEEALFEEHRFPMPFTSLEWPQEDDRFGVALHTLPSPVPGGHLYDQWWSMGLSALALGSEFSLLTGPCASNGRRSVIKALQPGFVPYPDSWIEVKPGAVIEKSFWLDAYAVNQEGAGFSRPTHASLHLFAPQITADLPSLMDILRAKWRFARTRWYEKKGAAGFRKFPDKNILVMGWCGQTDAMGYALPVLAGRMNDAEAILRAQKMMDFLSTAEYYEGGFHTWYDGDSGKWSHDEPLSQAQAMLSFAHAINYGEKHSFATTKWREFLSKACEFHARRILEEKWNPRSTDQAFFIAPLCEGFKLFGDAALRTAAVKAGERYAKRSLSMREPYWGGTLDAQCEDKEGAFAALQGFLALYDLTKEPRYIEWAKHAGDVVLTYVVVWDIDLPAGRLRDLGLKTRGWTVVSPQNQHIDMFGALIAPWLYRLGDLTGDSELRDLSLLMYRTCGQGIDARGSQGEQLLQTNYAQRGDMQDLPSLRGGYVEDWTVFWITAHFLNAAALFDEMGIRSF
jgi:hypothetical protein